MLTSLLIPSWKSSDYEAKLLDWERILRRYEEVSGSGIPEDIKSAIVMKWAPEEVKNLKTIFKGFWKSGKRQGYGCFYYNNGCKI